MVAALAAVLMGSLLGSALAADVGSVKVVKGTVHIERGGQKVSAAVGARVRKADVIVTGADGSAGIAFADTSLLSVGPDTVLTIDAFAFDPTTHAGAFETTLGRGTLSVVSGKIARQTPEAMKVRTPAAILGVRGTELLVRTGEAAR
jgi:hypothetical protein